MRARFVMLGGLLMLSGCSLINPTAEFSESDAATQLDAGEVDAAMADAGASDAGEPDAAVDGGCEATCGGSCVDLNRDPLHCGDCNHACSAPDHGEATCTEGSCGFECAPGYYAVVGTCEPRLAPRPIAPLSTATATSRRPTFRWELAPRNDGARIEICADRACTAILQTIDASGTSARPPTDLPTGVVFWRLYGRQGTDVGATASSTWQLYIGARSADVDTSWGTTLDVNGDGFADVLVGSTDAAYLYLGSAAGVSASPIALDNGSDGGYFGSSVASAGDVDGDGYADVIIGAPHAADQTGRAYLFHGGAGGLSPTPIVLDDGTDGSEFGTVVASAGDVDADGYADVVIGAPITGFGGAYVGRAYLYRGGPDGLSSSPIVIENPSIVLGFGLAVASAGDVDGDGYADVVIGTFADSGEAYLYSGGAGGLSLPPTVIDNQGEGGVEFAYSVASAGDVDGDGYADVIIGARRAKKVYLYRGGAAGLSSSPVVLNRNAELFGASVASAGDVDGDGYADILIGAPGPAGDPGRAYFFRGGAGGLSMIPVVLDNRPDGGRFGSTVASAGDVDGDTYGDVLIRGAGQVYVLLGSRSGFTGSPIVLNP